MQIARIVPKVRTLNTAIFDYSIPPEILPQIKPGILVEVPFHGRKLEGIIIDLKHRSDIETLKPIDRIIYPEPVVDEIHIRLAQWMSEYYLAPFGKTLFENVVPPAIRAIKNKSGKITINFQTKKKLFNPKKYLIQADFNRRLNYYLESIRQTIKKGKQVIILVPDLLLVSFFTNKIAQPLSIIHAQMTRTQRWLEWDNIRSQKSNIIIGSLSALFSPAYNLGLIIVDQEENETYKNDRSPRFNAIKVAEKLSEIAGANLILGSLAPRIETYFDCLNKNIILKKSNLAKNPEITIIDMNFEKQVISVPLQKRIDEVLRKNQKIVLVLNRKGEGTKFSCADCGWAASCQKCGLPIIPKGSSAICFHCDREYPLPEACPKCQSIKIRPFGLGTARIKKFISDFWPKTKIIRIEKELNEANSKNNWDIAIVTNYALKFNFPSIGLVGIIDADQGLNFPDFRSSERTFQNLYKFLKIGEQGIIQTHLPENYVISDLARLDYNKFFLDEIENRKKSNFPPLIQLIRLLYKNPDDSVCKEETQKIYYNLDKLITDNRLPITILGPSPAFIKKERNKFRWQIILKLKKRNRGLDDFLRTLPIGWIVDVDPIDLL